MRRPAVRRHTSERKRRPGDNRLGYFCSMCRQWWTCEPSSACPGVPVFFGSWEAAQAAGLRTKTQWKELRRRLLADAQPVAVFPSSREWYGLYIEAQTVAMRNASPAQRAVLERGRKTQRTCTHCGREQVSTSALNRRGVCYSCVWERRAAREAAMLATARREVEGWAGALLTASDWVILDTETTGLDDAELVEVAVVSPDGSVLLQSLVRPTVPISAGAQAVHGLTDAMVAEAPTFPEVYPRLVDAIAGRRVLGYNVGFDAGVLSYTCRRHGLPPMETERWLDLMGPYAAWFGEWSEYHRDFRWQPLPGSSHGAREDCLAALALLRLMATPTEADTSGSVP